MPFLIIAGLFGAVAFLLTSRKQGTTNPQAFNPNAPAQPGYGQPGYTTEGKSLQQIQIEKFSAIAALAGASVTGTLAGFAATAAAAGPIGAAVAGVIIAIGAFRGTAHIVARAWTDKVQDPFGKALALIVDEKDNALRGGYASGRSVSLARQAVITLYYGQYKTVAEQFATRGPDYRLVINQSYETLDPIVAKIISDMDNQIRQLGG